jgi:hypothetical protein
MALTTEELIDQKSIMFKRNLKAFNVNAPIWPRNDLESNRYSSRYSSTFPLKGAKRMFESTDPIDYNPLNSLFLN